MKGKKVFCSECAANGRVPKLLCVTEEVEGSFLVWCKSCRREIRVTVHNGHVRTEPSNYSVHADAGT